MSACVNLEKSWSDTVVRAQVEASPPPARAEFKMTIFRTEKANLKIFRTSLRKYDFFVALPDLKIQRDLHDSRSEKPDVPPEKIAEFASDPNVKDILAGMDKLSELALSMKSSFDVVSRLLKEALADASLDKCRERLKELLKSGKGIARCSYNDLLKQPRDTAKKARDLADNPSKRITPQFQSKIVALDFRRTCFLPNFYFFAVAVELADKHFTQRVVRHVKYPRLDDVAAIVSTHYYLIPFGKSELGQPGSFPFCVD
ncbi:hypothetical protein BOTBODRAFT_189459 [Botryobasidium botryosum FD-172 SS1]|uniref:Uncharacterized protein n=1 Tax=Botryobasidium botryosum (strain FD-172 SS1) TaxID=930990 RepID=A0A067M8W7_BOTB1|nr:hypothetical protein BOTBODRAFT_189459 [Botryobasidium botryosum FD-172 SS1]